MHVDDTTFGTLRVMHAETAVLEYVYLPTEAALESPRPYASLRTLAGVQASGYRPADHVWHKGLSLALPNVGDENFWGGPTYVRDEGYVQLPNNGSQVHRGFDLSEAGAGVVIIETLDWLTADGSLLLTEVRTLTARVIDEAAWALTWRSALHNTGPSALAFGSPTTRGRQNAGYAGIFWRGPGNFTGGEILTPHGSVGDAARGTEQPWLAYLAPRVDVGVLMLDAAPGRPTPWFARSAEFAGLGPAPFFSSETSLASGATLTLGAVVIVGDHQVAALAPTAGARMVAELSASTLIESERTP